MLREYLALLRADAALAVGGIHKAVAGLPAVAGRSVTGPELTRMRRAAQRVKRAALAYRPGARCLPQALATARLLRAEGYPVTLVVAVQRFPFAAHAWVECQGQVLTDRQAVRREYQPILQSAPRVPSGEVAA